MKNLREGILRISKRMKEKKRKNIQSKTFRK